MPTGSRFRLSRPLVAAAVTVVALAASTLPAVNAAAVGNCTTAQMPEVYPVDQLQKGMHGTGRTVIEGRQPESFDVEILGVQQDGIAPGVDFILVKVSGPVIDQTGGIAFGFSGSPVTMNDGRLLGSVSYGFSLADHTIGGVTPAEAMVPLFDYPSGSPAAQAAMQAQRTRSVQLSPTMRRTAAREAGTSIDAFPGSARQLLLPVAMSGLNDRAMDQFQRVVDALKLPIVPYRAGAAGTPQAPSPTPLAPGDSFAAVASYGDLTVGGIGTLTAVCGDLSLAFGHPAFFDGSTTMGMNGADILATIRDPSEIEGPFKFGTIEESHGTVDQDRLTGVRGIEGQLPTFVPVTVNVSNPDLPKTRNGETDVVKQSLGGFSLFPELAGFTLLLEQDAAFDRIGGGTDSVAWILHGETADGEPWTLTRQNMFFSSYDASFSGIFELLNDLYLITENRFEPVTFTSLHVDATITQQEQTTTIQRVLVWNKADQTYSERKRIRVRPGQKIRLQVELLNHGETTPTTVNVTVPVPQGARSGGELVVRGGGSDGDFFFDEGYGNEDEPTTFDDLLTELSNAEHGNDLVAELTVSVPRSESGQAKKVKRQSRVVLGAKSITVVLSGAHGNGGVVVGGKGGGCATTGRC